MSTNRLQQYETLGLNRLPMLESDTPEGWAKLWAEVKLLPASPWPPEARPSVKPRRQQPQRNWAAHIGRLLVGAVALTPWAATWYLIAVGLFG